MSEYEKFEKRAKELRCRKCYGYGIIDDSEPGDISCNEWKCPKCNGTGFKDGKEYRILG